MFDGLTAPTTSRDVFSDHAYVQDMRTLVYYYALCPSQDAPDLVQGLGLLWMRPGARDAWAAWDGRCNAASWFTMSARWGRQQVFGARKPLPMSATPPDVLPDSTGISDMWISLRVHDKHESIAQHEQHAGSRWVPGLWHKVLDGLAYGLLPCEVAEDLSMSRQAVSHIITRIRNMPG